MSTSHLPVWEVFVRARNGVAHKHAGSVHAADAEMALMAARDVYTRRGEGVSLWVVEAKHIYASDPHDKGRPVRAHRLQAVSPPHLLRSAR